MAEVAFLETAVLVRLSRLEKVGALHGNLAVPRAAVRNVRMTDQPFAELRGLRFPGTGFPGLIELGTYRARDRKPDFYAVYRGRPAIVVDLDAEIAGYERLVVSMPEGHDTVTAWAGATTS
jgi:hypothetical protein